MIAGLDANRNMTWIWVPATCRHRPNPVRASVQGWVEGQLALYPKFGLGAVRCSFFRDVLAGTHQKPATVCYSACSQLKAIAVRPTATSRDISPKLGATCRPNS